VTAEQASIVHTETTTQHASTHNIVQRRTQYRISSRKQFTPFDGLVFGSIRYESRQTSLRGHVNESVHFNGRYIKKKKKNIIYLYRFVGDVVALHKILIVSKARLRGAIEIISFQSQRLRLSRIFDA
jgi:hypothetical protein